MSWTTFFRTQKHKNQFFGHHVFFLFSPKNSVPSFFVKKKQFCHFLLQNWRQLVPKIQLICFVSSKKIFNEETNLRPTQQSFSRWHQFLVALEEEKEKRKTPKWPKQCTGSIAKQRLSPSQAERGRSGPKQGSTLMTKNQRKLFDAVAVGSQRSPALERARALVASALADDCRCQCCLWSSARALMCASDRLRAAFLWKL